MMVRDRPRWRYRQDFFFVVSAFLMSPVALWKFPVLWKQNGGVALLIPYTIFFLTVGLPLVYLEVSLGQFMQKAGPGVWGVVPLLKGLSATSMLLCVLKVSTNITLTSWCGNYLYLILSNQLPGCLGQAVKPHPFVHNGENENITQFPLDDLSNVIDRWIGPQQDDQSLMSVGVASEVVASRNAERNLTCLDHFATFWRRDGLEMSGSITTPGTAVIHIFIAVVIVCLLSFLLATRGVGWLAKIMYVLAPLPLVGCLLFILWTALSGWDAGGGVASLLRPNFVCLTYVKTWSTAARSVVLTLGLGVGVLPSVASHNRLPTCTIRLAWLVSSLGVFVNVLASLSVFALLRAEGGSRSYLDSDPSFLFVAIPATLTSFQHHPVLSVLFFIVLIIASVGTTAVYIECLVSAIVDLSHSLRQWRLLIVMGTLALCFLLAIPMSMQGGLYVFKLMDRAADEGFVLIIVTLLQCVGVAWVYGGQRFYDNLEMMTGKTPHWWFRYCLAWFSPTLLLFTLVCQEYHEPFYSLSLGQGHPYYELARVLLILMMAVLLLPIPVVAIWVVCSKRGSCFKKLRSAIKPQLQPFQVPIRWRLEGHWQKFSDL